MQEKAKEKQQTSYWENGHSTFKDSGTSSEDKKTAIPD
jgi:hypothetical protein